MFIKDEVLCKKICQLLIPVTQEIHLCGRCESLLLTESLGENESRLRSDCLGFLSKLTSQTRKRFPFESDSIIALLNE